MTAKHCPQSNTINTINTRILRRDTRTRTTHNAHNQHEQNETHQLPPDSLNVQPLQNARKNSQPATEIGLGAKQLALTDPKRIPVISIDDGPSRITRI